MCECGEGGRREECVSGELFIRHPESDVLESTFLSISPIGRVRAPCQSQTTYKTDELLENGVTRRWKASR